MLKNLWVCLGVVLGSVACSGDDDGGPPASATGGAGGLMGVGGTVATGGATGTGGAAATGGVQSSGGVVGAGGGPATGGAIGTGGSTSGGAGGTPGSGGASTGGSTSGGAGGSSTGGAGGSATGGTAGTGGAAPVECKSTAPAEFQANATVGPGGAQFKDSPHFRVYGNASAATVDATLNHLEAAYNCFVETLCFRSPGLAVQKDDGPYYKMNIYGVGSLGSAAGVMRYDARQGLSYLEVLTTQLSVPRVTVHEFGHGLALTEYGWVDQQRTGAWWEPMANWVADTYLTSNLCDASRKKFGIAEGATIIDLNRVIGQSYLLIVSQQNYYEAWPIYTYLTSNPDNYPGLGRMAVPNMMRKHPRNNETPLHVLERVAAPVKVQTILGRYWARMAYLDIGHPKAQAAFMSRRGSLNFANLDSSGSGNYTVKAARRPQYGGANIIPLTGTGNVSVQVTKSGAGNFTATLAIRASGGAVRYVDLPNGTGQATVASGEEASLVVANTPDTLIQYDAFQTTASSPESVGLNYSVQITGATVAN